jgi:hypothetical protein
MRDLDMYCHSNISGDLGHIIMRDLDIYIYIAYVYYTLLCSGMPDILLWAA